jgi:hypothetical protein
MWWRKRSDRPERKVLRCSFCSKWQHSVRELIAGPPGVFICDECVEVCNDMIADAERVAKSAGETSGPRPEEPLPWPNAIQCALCRVPIAVNEGLVIAGNRGALCADCANAVELAATAQRQRI